MKHVLMTSSLLLLLINYWQLPYLILCYGDSLQLRFHTSNAVSHKGFHMLNKQGDMLHLLERVIHVLSLETY